jgi:hypothetical protein
MVACVLVGMMSRLISASTFHQLPHAVPTVLRRFLSKFNRSCCIPFTFDRSRSKPVVRAKLRTSR